MTDLLVLGMLLVLFIAAFAWLIAAALTVASDLKYK
jgi:hypothetical protein